MFGVKSHGLPVELHRKLSDLSAGGESGIPGVAVKCVDIGRNANGESSFLACFLTLRHESQGSERD